MPRTFSSLRNQKPGKHLYYFWYCPKCGIATHEDCKIVEQGDYVRLKHKCGALLKPIDSNRFRGYDRANLERVIEEIRRENKENKK